MSHRPSETGGTLADITNKGQVMPQDVYQHPEWYANMDEATYKESFRAIQQYKGKPKAEVTIYRTAPKKELNKGDWVTLSKKYAEEEALKEGYPVHSFKVKAQDIQFAGDDINEFGYYPKNVAQQSSSVQSKGVMQRKLLPENIIKTVTERKGSAQSQRLQRDFPEAFKPGVSRSQQERMLRRAGSKRYR